MWDAHLVEGPTGKPITPDGWSPEYVPVRDPDGKVVIKEDDRTPQPGASYDQQIVWDLFGKFIEALQELGMDDEITWKDGKVTGYCLRALQPKQVTVRVNGQIKVVSVTEPARQFTL